jgi:gliding motility associated protien GldN
MKSTFVRMGAVVCLLALLAGQAVAQPADNKPSQKPTSGLSNLPPDNRTPIAYDQLRVDDALYVEKVWREIDLREKINQTFRYDAVDDKGSQLFINILLNAVERDSIQAFSDERFTTLIKPAEIIEKIQGKADTQAVYNKDKIDVIDSFVVTHADFDPKTVTRIRLLEEWIFDKQGSRLRTRIIGIAPLKTEYLPDGRERNGSSVLFWVYYPDLRPALAASQVYNPKNMGPLRMTWEELFESRMFSSYIVKSTLDNSSNKNIRTYIRDSKLALLEGENISSKIANYEQDMWSN